MKDAKQLELKLGGSSHVRFSDKEYKQVQKDSFKTSKSIPSLLKDTYFNGRPTEVLMSREDLKIVRKDLNKIGNNLNQVIHLIMYSLRLVVRRRYLRQQ